mmetsp:Transcript_1822/g.2627  ORF Transcript_1822/g.2627 Transcript_1822/m.2627 type:complete len:191 (+) Transcript_1822:38-610(+)
MGSLGTGTLQSFRLRCHSWPPSALSSASIYTNITCSLKNQLQFNKPGMVTIAAKDEKNSTVVVGNEKKPQLLVPKPRKAVAMISHSNLLFTTADHQDKHHNFVGVSENEEVKAVEEIQSIMMGSSETTDAVVAPCTQHKKISPSSHYPLRENIDMERSLSRNNHSNQFHVISNYPTGFPEIFRISPDFEL